MNILQRHFGLESLFFLRVSGRPEEDEYEIKKELHLLQVHTTCERCSIEDCPNKAAEPLFIKQEIKRKGSDGAGSKVSV